MKQPTKEEVEATLARCDTVAMRWMKPLLESWLQLHALVEEVALGTCECKTFYGHDGEPSHSECLRCRARKAVAGE